MYVKAFIVNVYKRLKPFFLERHINIVNRVTPQSFWFIFSLCVLDRYSIWVNDDLKIFFYFLYVYYII